uniref:Porin family protein n=1 Tax=Roseihalotalea indica TaxID=2867963 RepID=A0AA49JEX5_9BACT|nr:porin family protein [Tunicatimonas sp. TK19036]
MKQPLLLFLLLAPLTMFAQQKQTGVLGGVTLSNYSVSDFYDSTEPIVGVYAGVYRNMPISTILSIEPGLFLSQKGVRSYVKSPSSSQVDPTVSRTTLSYLQIPAVLRTKVTQRFSLHTGIYMAFLAHSVRQTTGPSAGQVERQNMWGIFERQLNSPYADFDAGLQAGIRYTLPTQWVLNASYDHGLQRHFSKAFNDGPMNRSVSVSVGYQW